MLYFSILLTILAYGCNSNKIYAYTEKQKITYIQKIKENVINSKKLNIDHISDYDEKNQIKVCIEKMEDAQALKSYYSYLKIYKINTFSQDEFVNISNICSDNYLISKQTNVLSNDKINFLLIFLLSSILVWLILLICNYLNLVIIIKDKSLLNLILRSFVICFIFVSIFNSYQTYLGSYLLIIWNNYTSNISIINVILISTTFYKLISRYRKWSSWSIILLLNIVIISIILLIWFPVINLDWNNEYNIIGEKMKFSYHVPIFWNLLISCYWWSLLIIYYLSKLTTKKKGIN